MSSRRLARRYGLLAFVLGVAIVGACATGTDDADFGDSENTTSPTTANVGQGGATAQTNGPATSGETDGAGGTGNVSMQQSAQSTAQATQQSSATGLTSTGTGFTSSASGLTSSASGSFSPCMHDADCASGECCLFGQFCGPDLMQSPPCTP